MMQLVSQTYFLPKHPCVYTVSSLLMIDMHIVIIYNKYSVCTVKVHCLVRGVAKCGRWEVGPKKG